MYLSTRGDTLLLVLTGREGELLCILRNFIHLFTSTMFFQRVRKEYITIYNFLPFVSTATFTSCLIINLSLFSKNRFWASHWLSLFYYYVKLEMRVNITQISKIKLWINPILLHLFPSNYSLYKVYIKPGGQNIDWYKFFIIFPLGVISSRRMFRGW